MPVRDYDPPADAPEHVDVLIVGAGLSGIGAACHLQAQCPGKSYAILESRDCSGGTWDLFRYPGIRSDSDMYTLGYDFRPWRDAKSIADGPSILRYVRETAREHGVERHIRYRHRVVRAQWCSADARWTVSARRGDRQDASDDDAQGVCNEESTVTLTCSFLFICSGYYRYDQGYTPRFEGSERFAGRIVHPQHWSEDIDYTDKRVVVVGSGATAITLVPTLAQRAAHVTMLQRSPSYIVSMPARDPLAGAVRGLLPVGAAYALVRAKNVLLTMLSFQLSRRRPQTMKALLRKRLQQELPPGYDIDTHFKPRYDPWDQRLCLSPDGDLFAAIRAGSVSVATDRISAFTEHGLQLQSGGELAADLVVLATGLELLPLGGIELVVDDRTVDLGQTLSYKGMMLDGIPNLAFTIGYTNASWTLKADLVCRYVCRLLTHMDARGYRQCTPHERDLGAQRLPAIDFSSGYVLRAIDRFPKQGAKTPWRLRQNYPLDVVSLRYGSLEDGAMQFAHAAPPVTKAEVAEPLPA